MSAAEMGRNVPGCVYKDEYYPVQYEDERMGLSAQGSGRADAKGHRDDLYPYAARESENTVVAL